MALGLVGSWNRKEKVRQHDLPPQWSRLFQMVGKDKGGGLWAAGCLDLSRWQLLLVHPGA